MHVLYLYEPVLVPVYQLYDEGRCYAFDFFFFLLLLVPVGFRFFLDDAPLEVGSEGATGVSASSPKPEKWSTGGRRLLAAGFLPAASVRDSSTSMPSSYTSSTASSSSSSASCRLSSASYCWRSSIFDVTLTGTLGAEMEDGSSCAVSAAVFFHLTCAMAFLMKRPAASLSISVLRAGGFSVCEIFPKYCRIRSSSVITGWVLGSTPSSLRYAR